MAYLEVDTKGETYITVRAVLDSASDRKFIDWYDENDDYDGTTYCDNFNDSYTHRFRGLDPDIRYTFSAKFYEEIPGDIPRFIETRTVSGRTLGEFEEDYRPPTMFFTLQAFKDGIEFAWNCHDNDSGFRVLEVYLYPNTTDAVIVSFASNATHTMTHLLPGIYSFLFRCYDNAGNWIESTDSIEVVGNLRPSNFEWTLFKASGFKFLLGAQEWNDFFDRINEFRVYKKFPEYFNTTVFQGDAVEAYMYRQAVEAIRPMNGSVPPLRYSGDDIRAIDIVNLKEALNSVV